MKILMVLPSKFPPDIRVEKEARSLIGNGHNIHLICPQKENQSLIDEYNGIIVYRFKENEGKTKHVLPYIWNPIIRKKWINEIENIIREKQIKMLHVHDLPVVKIAIKIGKKMNIPVIFDMHENWPEALRVYAKYKSKIVSHFRVMIHKIREKYCIANSDHIIVVVQEQKERLLKLGVNPEKITIVMNTEEVNRFREVKKDTKLNERYKNKYVITYVGGFGFHRGLETAIMAMSIVQKEMPDALLLLVGRGKNYEQLQRLCSEKGVEKAVEFTGWVDFDLIPNYIKISNICLVPHNASRHTDTTIPHKIFQYMLLKKPVIVTSAKPLKRIVEEADCGIVVPSENYIEMAEAIKSIYHDPSLSKNYGNNGREAVLKKYNWKTEAQKLSALYRKFNR